jgi:hypothetical protein
MQSFQCPVCGTFNTFGEPSCAKCSQAFVYNCPICGHPINNLNNICTSCRTRFNWYVQTQPTNIVEPPIIEQIQYQEMEREQPSSNYKAMISSSSKRLTSKPSFWLMLIIVCVILIVILLFVDRVVS